MKPLLSAYLFITITALPYHALGADDWYKGDARCPPPKDDGTYSAPYRAMDHPNEYPIFKDADKPGWSCSYQREDGTVIQFGDSRTPQEQWLAIWGTNDNH